MRYPRGIAADDLRIAQPVLSRQIRALEHVAAGRGISFLGRSATVFYSHPEVSYAPVADLAPDQVCLAVAASRNSPLVDDFLTAAQATSDITAECGNHEMWQLGGEAASKHG